MQSIRLLLVLALLALPAFCQGLESRVSQALNPDVGPGRRVDLLTEIVNTSGGVEALVAQGGLAPDGDTEVVHAVVDAMIGADKHLAVLDRICLLLASGNGTLRDKIAARVLGEGENTERATAMLKGLRDHALGVTPAASSNEQVRLGAVRALALIPLRGAIELLVDAWEKEAGVKPRSAKVLAEYPLALADVVPAQSPQEARAYLAKRGGDSYWVLRQEVTREGAAELARLREVLVNWIGKASASDVHEVLTQRDARVRAAGAQRIAQIADKAKFGPTKPEDFARKTFEAFSAESDRRVPSMEVLTLLAEAMAELATNPWKESPLAKAVGAAPIVAKLDPLARNNALPKRLGSTCVRLLDALGPEGTAPLIRFARVSRITELRIEAIRRLGNRARQGAESQARIGAALTGLLGTEKDRGVLKQVLVSLKQAPVVQAAVPVRALLLPEGGAKSELSTIEARDSVAILQQIATKEALDALLAVTTTHPDTEVRGYAVREGLLPRLVAGNGEIGAILEALGQLVRDPKQSKALREGVVRAMAESGSRQVHAPLSEVASNESLSAELRQLAREGKLSLAKRLATVAEGQSADKEDLATAVKILSEEAAIADPARLDELALAILDSAAGKIPTGKTRALRASIHGRMPKVKEIALLNLYKEAADQAQPDGLAPADEVRLLEAYRALLLKPERASAERVTASLRCSERLAALAGGDKSKAASHLLDATQVACERLKDKARAEALLQNAAALGPLTGPLATRLAEIRTKVNELP